MSWYKNQFQTRIIQKIPVKILEIKTTIKSNTLKNLFIKTRESVSFLWFSIRNWHGTFTNYLHRRLEIVRNSRKVWHPEIPVEFNLTATTWTATKKNSAGKKSSGPKRTTSIGRGTNRGSQKVFVLAVIQVGWKNSCRMSDFCKLAVRLPGRTSGAFKNKNRDCWSLFIRICPNLCF